MIPKEETTYYVSPVPPIVPKTGMLCDKLCGRRTFRRTSDASLPFSLVAPVITYYRCLDALKRVFCALRREIQDPR